MEALKIAGIPIEIANLEIGKTVSFNGSGKVLASAIMRMSKNRYKVLLITEKNAALKTSESLSEAIGLLQKDYAEQGGLLALCKEETEACLHYGKKKRELGSYQERVTKLHAEVLQETREKNEFLESLSLEEWASPEGQKVREYTDNLIFATINLHDARIFLGRAEAHLKKDHT